MSATAIATRGLLGGPFVDTIARSTDLSRCGAYRSTLIRARSSDGAHVCFIGLNPSRADHERDDPTVRRWIHFAQSWGYGGFTAVNAYPRRTSNCPFTSPTRQPAGQGPSWASPGTDATSGTTSST